MELRTTEGKINDLLAVYEGIRGLNTWKPEQQTQIPATPLELVAEGKTSVSTTATVISNEDDLIRALRSSKALLTELRPRVEKIRKRLFEIDPVTEKPRYGPKSQTRVQLLVARSDFLCSQYQVDFPKQYQNQRLHLEEYWQQQLDLQDQRQEERRQEHLKQEEIRKQKREQENAEESPTSTKSIGPPPAIDERINPDGSLIIAQSNRSDEKNDLKPMEIYMESSPSSIFFEELQRQYELRKEEEQRIEASKENERIKMEDEKRRREVEIEANRKAMEAQKAAAEAADEAARLQHLHQQAEEARRRRLAQEEIRIHAEREWLDGIKKGIEGVKYYLNILLQRSASTQQVAKDTDVLDPDRIIALQSLCTLFEQIQKHPEEVNRRKIKRTNPNFQRDIGRHEGGIELLIAAGFRPIMMPITNSSTQKVSDCENKKDNTEEIEDQPEFAFLVSKEPNLEHDMDGWMTWFDLNKATLELLQTELTIVKGGSRSCR